MRDGPWWGRGSGGKKKSENPPAGRAGGLLSGYLRMLSRSRLPKEEAEKAERKQRVHGATRSIRHATGSRKGVSGRKRGPGTKLRAASLFVSAKRRRVFLLV